MDRQLIEYLPEWLRDFREIKILCEKQQEQAEQLWEEVENLYNNSFVEDLNEEGCSKWEQMLDIRKKDSYTLEERKSLIASRIAEQRPYTFRSLNNMLRILCGEDGYTIALDHAKYSLKIKIALTSKNTYQDVSDLVKRVIPANLLCDIGLMYNTYGFLKGNKHREMAQYTYKQLRDEVIF